MLLQYVSMQARNCHSDFMTVIDLFLPPPHSYWSEWWVYTLSPSKVIFRVKTYLFGSLDDDDGEKDRKYKQ